MKYFLPLLLLTTGCYLTPIEQTNPTRPSITLPSQTPPAATLESISTPFAENVFDGLPVMQGICFEAAWDAAGQVFIIRTAEEHINFYNLVDNSRLCRRTVERLPFDFSTGDVLSGLWNRGNGCTASHTVSEYSRDDNAKTIRIRLIFETEGDCPYELVRGFWIGLNNASDYQISIQMDN